MTIGERIKQLRIEKGMTQLELANALFVTDRAISKWEQGRGNPDISIIPNLASTLGVSIDYLMTGNEYQPKIDRSQVEVIRYFESVVEQKIAFDHLRRALIKYTNTYSLEEIKDAIDICYERYLIRKNMPISTSDLKMAIHKIGGILHNQQLSPLNKKIQHLIAYLSKNSVNPTPELKKYCSKTIFVYLSYLYPNGDETKQMSYIESMYKKSMEEKYDLLDVIALNTNSINNFERKQTIVNKLENGYFQKINYAPTFVNERIEGINKSIASKNRGALKDNLVSCLDECFKDIICKVDPDIKNRIPHIKKYYKDLYSIFGRFLNRKVSGTIEHLLDVFLNPTSKIKYSQLESFNYVLQILVKKSKRHLRSCSNNFDRYLLLKHND